MCLEPWQIFLLGCILGVVIAVIILVAIILRLIKHMGVLVIPNHREENRKDGSDQ